MGKLKPPRATGGHTQPHSHGPLITGPKHPTDSGPAGGRPELHGLWPSGIELGFIRVATDDGQDSFVCELGADKWQQAGGVANYDAQERPKRRTVLIYKGDQGYEMTVPICFEGFKKNISQEAGIGTLEYMARVRSGETEPPRIQWDTGGAVPHDRTRDPHRLWVITNYVHGDFEVRDTDADRIRQHTVLTLSEYTTDPILRTGFGEQGKKYRRYTVVKGDTLKKLAQRFLGSKKKWKVLATLNQTRDGNHLLVGSVLLIPEKKP